MCKIDETTCETKINNIMSKEEFKKLQRHTYHAQNNVNIAISKNRFSTLILKSSRRIKL